MIVNWFQMRWGQIGKILLWSQLSLSTTRGQWKCIDLSLWAPYFSVITLKSLRGVVGEFCDFKHFTLLRVWDYKLIPATLKRQWREHASEGAVWKKALLMKTEWRKDKVLRGNPLFKCQAVGAILSPALISSFLPPSGLRFLTFVSPSWPFACLCRWAWLNTCQVTTDVHHPFGWRGGT